MEKLPELVFRDMNPIDPSISSSTVAGDLTPTHSMATTDLLTERRSSIALLKETPPWPGHTYIIRHPVSGRQITLVRGELRLEHHTGNQGGYHWICVEKDGWLGFCDPVHGTYMGCDTLGGYISKVKHHKACEFFCTRRHPDGGYVLLTQSGPALAKMSVAADGSKLVETKGEGTAWEFVKV
ncbi:hypothetical protein F5Y13DRAFT_170621 [Hypoxylon sp. FL1857]|nr:hypothetical protein F5Y13DRAFT_170621 [Hypoxylon sp. FL1857]